MEDTLLHACLYWQQRETRLNGKQFMHTCTCNLVEMMHDTTESC